MFIYIYICIPNQGLPPAHILSNFIVLYYLPEILVQIVPTRKYSFNNCISNAYLYANALLSDNNHIKYIIQYDLVILEKI